MYPAHGTSAKPGLHKDQLPTSGGDEPALMQGVAAHIARTAAQLFAARGYDATSVREIVEASGVTKPTLYYHFGSKEGLAHALLFKPVEQLCEKLTRLVDEETDGRRLLERLFAAKFDFCRDDPDRARLVYAVFFGPLASGLANDLARLADTMDCQWSRAAERCAALGLIDGDPQTAATFTLTLRGVGLAVTAEFLYRGRELASGLPQRLVHDILRGFAPGARTGNDHA